MISIIINNLIFATFLAMANGWIARQIDVLYKDNAIFDRRLEEIFKSQWHNYAMLPLRVLVPLMFAYLYAGGISADFFHSDFFRASIIGLTIQFVPYDTFIDLVRQKFTWRYNGVCEGKWDFDCAWLWLQDHHINHLVVKGVISTAIILYVIYQHDVELVIGNIF